MDTCEKPMRNWIPAGRIEEGWEYFTSDSEVYEVVHQKKSKNYDGFVEYGHESNPRENIGVRFGKGNPDNFFGTLGPEKHNQRSDRLPAVVCPCGGWFTPGRKGSKYCSRECYTSVRSTIPEVQCGECEMAFRPCREGIIFCSRSCYHRNSSIPAKDCSTCGNAFKPIREAQRYCSQSCFHATRKVRSVPNHTCEQCNKAFYTRCKGQRYCSRECFRSTIPRIEGNRPCLRCQKLFYRCYPNAKYCSRECFRTAGRLVRRPPSADKVKACGEMYSEGKSILKISMFLGMSEVTVVRYVKLAGVPRRTNGRPKVILPQIICKKCKELFTPRTCDVRYCSAACSPRGHLRIDRIKT